MCPPRAAVVLDDVSDLEGLLLAASVIGGLGWLFWPLLHRRDPPSPIPPASIGRRIDFEKLQRGRELGTGETLRVTLGVAVVLCGVGFLVVVMAFVHSMADSGGS